MPPPFRPRTPDAFPQPNRERPGESRLSPERRDAENPRAGSARRVDKARDALNDPEVKREIERAAIEKALRKQWVKSTEADGAYHMRYVGADLYRIAEKDGAVTKRDERTKRYERVSKNQYPPEVRAKVAEIAPAATSAPEQKKSPTWERKQSPKGDAYDQLKDADGTRYLVFLNGRVLVCPKGEKAGKPMTEPYPQIVQDRRRELKIDGPKKKPADAPKKKPEPESKKEEPKEEPEEKKADEPKKEPEEPQEKEAEAPAKKEILKPADVIGRLRSIEFKDKQGTVIPFTLSVDASYMQRNGIVKLEEYQANMLKIAENAQNVLKDRTAAAGDLVSFDGSKFNFSTANSERIAFTPVGMLKIDRANRMTRGDQSIAKNDMHRSSSRYDVYETDMTREYVDKSGKLRMREIVSGGAVLAVESYEGGAVRGRPSIIRVFAAEQQMQLREKNGSVQTVSLRNGIYFVPEEGAPIPRFSNARNDANHQGPKDAHILDAQDIAATREYGDNLARTLKTPEAITAFVTSNFDFVSRVNPNAVQGGNPFQGGGTEYKHDPNGVQDVHHPLRTLYCGTGDCEDMAVVIKYLCDRSKALNPDGPGANAFVAKSKEDHHSAYYVEEYVQADGSKAYALCQMHVPGFERVMVDPADGQPFRSANEALSQVWKGGQQTALDTLRGSDLDKVISRATPEVRRCIALRTELLRGNRSPDLIAEYAALKSRVDWGSVQMLMTKDLGDVNGKKGREGPPPQNYKFGRYVKKAAAKA